MNKQRRCVGCGEFKPRENLIRVMKNENGGEVVINPNSKTFGRSAYLCYNESCIEKAFKKNKLAKQLKTSVPNELKGQLLDELRNS